MRLNTMNETGNIDESCAIAVPTEPASGKWQPINTAPKDGTWVLTFSAPWAVAPAVLRWHGDRWWDDEVERPGVIEAWWPTHWMPLPNPPEITP